jgi:hypothetical protein
MPFCIPLIFMLTMMNRHSLDACHVWHGSFDAPPTRDLNNLEAVIFWFASPKRVMFHAISRAVRALLRPLIHLAWGIQVKRTFGFNCEYSTSSTSQIVLLRRYINSILLSCEELMEAFSILGTHYEMVSVSFIPNIAGAGKLMNHL